jgi:type I restriction enzyme, S subunit
MRKKSFKLGEVATFINGKAFKPLEWQQSGLPIIRIQNLTDNSKVYNYYKGKLEDRYLVKSGDILISWSASLGVFEWKGEDAALNQHIFKVQFNKLEVDKSYFKYIVSEVINEMLKFTHGSTMKHIVKKDFDNTVIPLPEISIQQRIATILDHADAIRRKNKEILEKYNQLAQSVFLEMFGDPVKNPKGWKMVPLSHVVDVRGRVGWKGYKRTDLREFGSFVLGATHLTNEGDIDLTEAVYISEEKFFESPEIIVQIGDIIFVQRGNTIGKVGLVKHGFGRATINPCVLILRPFFGNSIYLRSIFLNKKVNQNIWNMNKSSAQPMITQADIKNFQIPSPPDSIQKKFEAIIHMIESQKEYVNKSLEKSEELFHSLLQRAFKGEL